MDSAYRQPSSIGHRAGLTGLLAGSSLLACLSLLDPSVAAAAEYYVSPTGSDSAAGTLEAPFATMQKGHDKAAAGDTVWIRGGTYKIVNGATDMSGITLSKSGTSDSMRIKFFAYENEHPIFDFAQLKISSTKTSAGIYVTGNFLHLKGLEIMNVPMPGTIANNGIWNVGGSNNTFELLDLHNITGPGLSIAKGNGGHLILNVDSHDNYDPRSAQGAGQNADGFGVHYQTTGPSTVIRGCRAWWNSDDGYDLISQEAPVIIENSWAMGNGYINQGTARPASGNGNGFKAGSSKNGVRHVIRNSLAWKNPAAGFYANHSSGGNDWFNNTAYNNGTAFNMLASNPDDSASTIILTGAKAHKMRNNIGFPNKNSNMNGVDTASNSWDLILTPKDGDFVSVSDKDYTAPRKADGSLPDIDFMKLRSDSQFKDKGVDVKLPFVGSAPDLGAFELGATTSSAGGTSSGAGGSGGTSAQGGGGVGGSAAGAAGAAGTPGGSGSEPGAGGSSLDVPGTGGAAGTSAVAGSSAVGGSTAGTSSNVAGTSSSPVGSGGTGASDAMTEDESTGCAVAPSPGRGSALALFGTLGGLAWLLGARRRRDARLLSKRARAAAAPRERG